MGGFVQGMQDLLFRRSVIFEDITYYVNGGTGSDDNDGSVSAPFATIGKATGLLTGKVFMGSVTINVEAGTYAEAISINGFYVQNSLSIIACNGSVILTGIAIEANTSIYVGLVIAGYLAITSDGASSHFVPTPTTSSTYYAVYIYRTLSSVFINYVSPDFTSASGTNLGVYSLRSPLTVVANFACSNADYAIDNTGGRVITSGLTGSGNSVIYRASTGGAISLNTNSTIAGTTVSSKSNGSMIVDADGTLL
jgi:hypothetical protein